MSDVTFVITSCSRWDLLRDTIDSFLDCNTYFIKRYILSEDSGNVKMYEKIKKHYGHLFQYIIFNKDKPRQMFSIIDRAYSLVKTPYIFHCEDDWHFHKQGDFIEDSINILEENPKILQVHIRDKHTIVGQKIENTIHTTKKGVEYRHMTRWGEWNGFSLNPGVRRLSDYKLATPFSQFIQPSTETHSAWVVTEKTIAEFYTKKGFIGAHLGDYCYHTGAGRQV